MKVSLLILLCCFTFISGCHEAPKKPQVVVGSLKDVEGTILGELFAQVIENAGEVTVHRELGLGGTGVLFAAFEAHQIDLAPQYSATLANVVLKRPELTEFSEIKKEIGPLFDIGNPLGFNNTYGIGVRRELAQKHKIQNISDLKSFAWRGGVSLEFLDSEHGLSGLKKAYQLTLGEVKAMEHVISYLALKNNDVDFVDVYTTDASIEQQDLVVLRDDLNFFDRYEGVVLARKGFAEQFPKSWGALGALSGTLNDEQMTKLNAELELHQRDPRVIAHEFLVSRSLVSKEIRPAEQSKTQPFITFTFEHLFLVGVSLFFALIIAIPLGVWAGRRVRVGRWVLSVVGIVQTIPGVALLCFFIPFFGIGRPPALLALTLYALLPIVQGMITGLLSTSNQLHDVCAVLGMSSWQKLWRIEWPLALPALLAGIRIAAVTTVGTAALAAFIGAGGYGTPIAKGLALADWNLVLQGAIPSALMAMLLHVFLSRVERITVESREPR